MTDEKVICLKDYFNTIEVCLIDSIAQYLYFGFGQTFSCNIFFLILMWCKSFDCDKATRIVTELKYFAHGGLLLEVAPTLICQWTQTDEKLEVSYVIGGTCSKTSL